MKDFTCRVPLRWGDMDAMAHINNVVYFRLMEEARIQWFAQMGFSTLPQGEAPILAHASCDFMRALNYPGDAVVTQQHRDAGTHRARRRAGCGVRARPLRGGLVRLRQGRLGPVAGRDPRAPDLKPSPALHGGRGAGNFRILPVVSTHCRVINKTFGETST
jgi:hypothetical protein